MTLEDFNHAIPNTQLEHVGLFQAAASFSMRGIGTAGIESFADPVYRGIRRRCVLLA